MDAPIPPLEPTPATPPAAAPVIPTPAATAPATPVVAAPATPPPAAAPASAPATPKQHSGIAWKVIVVIAVLLALGVIAESLWVTYSTKPTLPAAPAAPAPVVITYPTPNEPVATSTSEAATTTAPYGGLTAFQFGQTAQLFADDEVVFDDLTIQNSTKGLKVKATGFTDSRCPIGNTCVWSGELGVQLYITEIASNTTQNFSLGMVRASSTFAFGHPVILKNIDEGKGGTFAEIQVNDTAGTIAIPPIATSTR